MRLIYITIAMVSMCGFLSAKPHSYVTCSLSGQLGNQLFQIATTLAYAWDYNAIPVFPDLNKKEHVLSYNRDRIFFRLNANPGFRNFNNAFREPALFSSERIPFQKNVNLVGYFQSLAHFNHHRERLLAIFAPSQDLQTYLNEKYGDLISNPKTVAIHVRTMTAKVHAEKFFHFLGLEYYRRAMSLFPSDTIFVVFSDQN